MFKQQLETGYIYHNRTRYEVYGGIYIGKLISTNAVFKKLQYASTTSAHELTSEYQDRCF